MTIAECVLTPFCGISAVTDSSFYRQQLVVVSNMFRFVKALDTEDRVTLVSTLWAVVHLKRIFAGAIIFLSFSQFFGT